MSSDTDHEWRQALDRLDDAMRNLVNRQAQITSSLNEALDDLARKNGEEVRAKLEAVAQYFELQQVFAHSGEGDHAFQCMATT